MRSCSGALALVLASGGVELWQADLFTFTLSDGTVYRWTSYSRDLTDGNGHIFSSKKPWLQRSKWNTTNTMEVPTLTVILRALNDSFAGGASIKAQIHNGLFDGATVLFERGFMPSENDLITLGSVTVFSGQVADINLDGLQAEINVKGLTNKLNVNVPRNVYQGTCTHTFCDGNCTLLRALFTTSYLVGLSPTRSFIPWTSAPGTPGRYQLGTLKMTSGPASGQSRTIQAADATGITLAYPLYNTPAPGDAFTAFEGCDKLQTTCQGRSNDQNWRGFPYVPPAETAY